MKLNKNNIKYYFILIRLKKLLLLFLSVASFFVFIKFSSYIVDGLRSFYYFNIYRINSNICNNVIINGIKYGDYNYIQSSINDYCSSNEATTIDLKNNILKDRWVKDLYIQKIFPDTIKINIVEYNPFAIYTKDGYNYNLIDEYGEIINIPKYEVERFNYLLIVVGKNLGDRINELFNLLSIYRNLSDKIYKVVRIGGRRWNLILENSVLVKMPEEDGNIFNVWDVLDKIVDVYGIDLDLEEIDLRIKGKIYLKYKSNTVNELKNIS